MTPKQIDRIRTKISDMRRILAAEKRKFGAYDDSRGLRYLPPRYFLQLEDYKGGLTYLRWFNKNFPDDGGFPDFLFEWSILLFKNGKKREAAEKAFETFCANTYLFDKFFGKTIAPVDKWEGSNLQMAAFTDFFGYSSRQPQLVDFSQWLGDLIATDDFRIRCGKYMDICKLLQAENDVERRRHLLMQARQLKRPV